MDNLQWEKTNEEPIRQEIITDISQLNNDAGYITIDHAHGIASLEGITGLGAYMEIASPTSNADNTTITGMYYLTGTGRPAGVVDGALFVMAHSVRWVVQLLIDWRTNITYTRVRSNSVWSQWVELQTPKTVLTDYTKTYYNNVAVYNNWLHFNPMQGSNIGTVAIALPKQNIMFDGEVCLRTYGRVAKILISGYTRTENPAWYLPIASKLQAGIDVPVRYATHTATGTRYILLGNTTFNWGGYLHLSIPRLTVGFGHATDLERWTASIITDEAGFVIDYTT